MIFGGTETRTPACISQPIAVATRRAVRSVDGEGEVSYRELEERQRKLGHLEELSEILGWDEAVIMPEAAGPRRGEAMATLSVLIHELAADPELGELIAGARAEGDQLDSWQRANLALIERAWRRATSLPADLVRASTEACFRCEQAWRRLRPENDWPGFRPLLEEVVATRRQVARALGDAFELSPYDALLDEYEPGARCARIDQLFAELRRFLPDFTRRVLEHQEHIKVVYPEGPFPAAQQRQLALRLMESVGFDSSRGRLDVSHHPFCGGVPTDVRITTRYDEGDFATGLMGVLHETGHAKYDQGLPAAWAGQPVGDGRSLGLHESQSLLLENQIGRSREFLQFAAPFMREAFLEATARRPEAFAADNLYRMCSRIQPGLIRVDADEVTYPSHVILRYEIERELIEGEFEVADIPERWDASMRRLLGVSTENDYRDGCMQDVHWAAGIFGYFPTYTLGALNAAQIFAALLRAHPDLPEQIAAGEFSALNSWLGDCIWSKASSLDIDELMTKATGGPLDVAYFERYLERRFLA